ncbi:Carboxypeptidase [Melia azedarach]|uniref:Carboxypeptidase n=1 Tax=Melia azedarach TaxID=155640 RepID=A0ACC1X6F5_MELAZ|nr:Carboxypeptidase [Melia azedarach]
MALTVAHNSLPAFSSLHRNLSFRHHLILRPSTAVKYSAKLTSIQCSAEPNSNTNLRTCKNCKTQFDPLLNHPRACKFHTAHFGGETKRKFESAYTGGTLDTPDSGKVFQYWHCCGSEDPFDPGCTAAPHSSYDD